MTKIEVVRGDMVKAMKAGEKEKKDALSSLLSAMKNAAIDKRSDLSEEEENAVVLREIKLLKESIESSPADRTDFIAECNFRISVMNEYAPVFMSEDEVKAVVREVLAGLGISQPTAADKGKIMKELMPKVKGKADGKVVNEVVAGLLQ
ncbi:MAG TPA: GatB/YqeY domain-containing protein [Lachnospiraceae bacterium]|nr:GatB/YqeY domain-containing protein [Lachnospiraceae bacterium]